MNGNGAVFFPAVESIVYAACWIERGSMQGAGSAVKKKGHLVKAEKSVLLIVPHADDELFVGGGLLKTLAQRQGYECFVVYTTNSDYFTHEGEERIRESLRVLIEIYGIIKKIFFILVTETDGRVTGTCTIRKIFRLLSPWPAERKRMFRRGVGNTAC